jgi:hypothetical protein
VYQQYFLERPGKEHYRFLAYVSLALLPGTRVADLGTLHGCSALALAANPGVHVTTYDIVDNGVPYDLPNVTKTLKNALHAVDEFADCPLVLLDVDPHDGIQERTLLRTLLDKKFMGAMVCDDIHLNPEMRSFWADVSLDKEDLTNIGHWSGTGIIYFSECKHIRSIVERAKRDLR